MNNDLPYLTPERLNFIFKDTYCFEMTIETIKEQYNLDEKTSAFICMLKQMQKFNYFHRPTDTFSIYDSVSKIIYLQPNSDGPVILLALILAIKEIYGFSDHKLISILRPVDFSNV